MFALIKNRLIVFLIFCFLFPGVIIAQVETKIENNVQKQVDLLIEEYQSILVEQNWHIKPIKNGLFVYKIEKDYREFNFTINSEVSNNFYILNVSIEEYSQKRFRKFKFIKSNFSQKNIRKLVLPFLLKNITPKEEIEDYNNYFSCALALGYSRTQDNHEIYPRYPYGNMFFNGKLIYDPIKNIKTKEMTGNLGKYVTLDIDIKFSSPRDSSNRPLPLDEMFFDVNFLVYGTNNYSRENNIDSRLLYGFFTSLEFYKSGLGANITDTGYDPHALTWDQKIYKDEPHLQYTLWRFLQLGFIYTISNKYQYTIAADAGFGFSINSSLAANSIVPGSAEEDDLSNIFKSTYERKENYYNSYCFPVTINLLADKVYGLRFGIDYNFYYFFPMENETAYDILNIARCFVGFYITENLSFNTKYEYWHIKSKLVDKKESHSWSRLMFDFTYNL